MSAMPAPRACPKHCAQSSAISVGSKVFTLAPAFMDHVATSSERVFWYSCAFLGVESAYIGGTVLQPALDWVST